MGHRLRLRVHGITALALGGMIVGGCRRTEPEPAPAPVSTPERPAPLTCPAKLHIELTYPGASIVEIERLVVMPVENELAQLDGLEQLEAIELSEGHASVWVQVPSSTQEHARQAVRERLSRITSFPVDVEEPVVSITSALGPAFVIISRAPPDILPHTVDQLQQALHAAPGTKSVRRHGQTPMELSIGLDPRQLTAMGVDRSALVGAVKRALVSSDGSSIIRTRAAMSIEELGNVIVSRPGASPVPLGHVAELRFGPRLDGPRAWAGGSTAELLLVESDDLGAVRRVLADVAATVPSEVHHAMVGRLSGRTCARSSAGPELGDDFELLELEAPALATGGNHTSALLKGAPTADDALWLIADSILGGSTGSTTERIDLLIATGSPVRDELVQWVQHTPGLAIRGHYGPARGHTVIEVQFPDPERLPDLARSLVDAAHGEGLHASTHRDSNRIELEVRGEVAARMGTNAYEISTHVRHALHGQSLGSMFDGDRMVSVLIEPSLRPDENGHDLPTLVIPTRSGSIALQELATLRLENQPVRLIRRNQKRVEDVVVWFPATERETVLETIDERLLPALLAAHPGASARRTP